MSRKISFLGLHQSVSELHKKLDNIQRFLHAERNDSQTETDPNSDWDYLDSIVALADFLECSYSTAKRLKKEERIKFIQKGTKIRFYIPAILEAIEKDDKVGKYIDRFCEKYSPANQPAKPEKEPEISIETELFPNRFVFIRVKYQRWSTTIVCMPELWEKQSEIRALVYEVILAQHDRKPFPIAPVC